ncbi:unnamed protein product [Zymoseptoria tritici ST99CH_3D7]|uniref:DUF7820 domain-containing protein n=2 Tax=Zymoseptoria tritici TaxID=1047171 RepID=A0A1X7RIG6_ZYMT9|nr:unnamed protein product [Zymoseptoria tritici ST99CH_3D7]SMR45742.1 unnamed protein product [Zymoseptoria tritici ST99CH_1E4]
MDRRSLLDDDQNPANERTDVFSDEFEVDDWDIGVADGFRPTAGRNSEERAARHGATEDLEDGTPIRTVSAHYAPAPPVGASGTRDSVRKSGNRANPFASPEDVEPERGNSLEFEPESNFAHRTLSTASSRIYAQTDSPRFGAGPSHPYGLYTQATMPRSPSARTAASSARHPSQRQSFQQNLPQHPYAMYPQAIDLDDVDADDDDADQIRPNPVPVGFPGLGQNYTRRLGPDGEDQGIIDEVGHTEQLPPYSRYPEDGPEKMPLLPPTLHSRAPVEGSDPTMALMHTTLQPSPTPVQQSMTDESALNRNSVAHSMTRMLSTSSATGSSAKKSWQHKTWKERTWRERRWTRFCGIPFWVILLVIGVFLFIATVLGGVIGGYKAGGKSAKTTKAATTTVVTSLYDASLMPSPTSGGPPTGTFALTLGDPEEVVNDCLANRDLAMAWDCNLAPNPKLGISIVESSDPDQGMGATLFYNSDDPSIAAGAQLAYMDTQFSSFLTVLDNDDQDNGLAFYFQSWYDKVVVVPEGSINLAGPSKRGPPKKAFVGSSFQVPDAWKGRKQTLTPGEKPWFCVWNDTFVEGFIYVNEPSVTLTTSSSSSSITPPPSTQAGSASSSTVTDSPTTGSESSSGTTADIATTTAAADIITKTIVNPFTTAVYTGPASELPPWASDEAMRAKQRAAYANSMHQKPKRQLPARYPDMPFVVKIEERRLAESPQPYCQQYQILDNGHANWAPGPDGKPIMVYLDELDPIQTADAAATGTIAARHAKRNGDPVPNSCHCQWMSGDPYGDPDDMRR